MRFIFTRSNGIISSAISGWDSGGASHVGMESPLSPGFVVHATVTKGVHVVSMEEFQRGRRLVAIVDLPLDEIQALDWLNAQVGKKYDISAIIGMASLRDWQDDDKWYCFELAMACALQDRYKLLTRHSEIGGRLCLELLNAWSKKI